MGELKVYFLPVGQGDSTYIELPNRQTMLVDINRHPGHGIDVVRFLKDRISKRDDGYGKRVRKLDYLVITHAHEDHIKGLKELDEEFVFGEVWDSGHEYEYGEDLWKEYKDLIQRYDKKGFVRYRKASSAPFTIGAGEDKVTFHVLSPSAYIKTGTFGGDKEKREAIHEESMVIRMSYRNLSVLLAGDSNKAAWERINKHYAAVLPSKILHASHHGSRTFFKKGAGDEDPLTEPLTNMKPKYLVVSVSHPSKHDHPHTDAMRLYTKVVKSENVRYTETSEGRQAHVLRVYKNRKDGTWYHSLTADEHLAKRYFLEEKRDLVATAVSSYGLQISARVGSQNSGPFPQPYPSGGRPLEKGRHIRFHIARCTVPEPYAVRWEVTNNGLEAESNNDVSHDSGIHHRGDSNFETRVERTKYRGTHHMDCVILKDGIVVCRTRYVVNIA